MRVRFGIPTAMKLSMSVFWDVTRVDLAAVISALKVEAGVSLEHCYVLRSEDAFIITCIANLMEVKVLYGQQDLRYEISSYLRFNV
jgi:hypothetical protein